MNSFVSLESFSLPISESEFHNNINQQKPSSHQLKYLINIEWFKFESEICSKLELEEALSLCIHKAFAMLCNLGLINKIFEEKSNIC